MEQIEERDLVIKFRDAKKKKDDLDHQLKEAKKEFERAESVLIEFLEGNEATSSAKYDGIGYVTIPKPRVYANCKKENQETLFQYLEEIERTDMIKTSVNSQTLSSFVKELLDEGKPIPEFIGHYLKTTLRFYDK